MGIDCSLPLLAHKPWPSEKHEESGSQTNRTVFCHTAGSEPVELLFKGMLKTWKTGLAQKLL